MGRFLFPTSGFSVGGGGHGETDPGPPGLDGPPDPDDDSLLGRTVSWRTMAATPPGQLPGQPPSSALGPFERLDWKYPTESLSRTKLRLLEDAPDANNAQRAVLHKQAQEIRQRIASLRQQLAQAIDQSRRAHEVDAAKARSKQQRSGVGVIADQPTLPKLPRATRTPFAQKTEADAIRLGSGTPLHMVGSVRAINANPLTQRIVNLRAEISKLRIRLAQIRERIRGLVGQRPMRHDIPMHAPAVGQAVKSVRNVRSAWLGEPKAQRAAPVGHAAQKLRTQWVRRPRPHSESQQFRVFRCARKWRLVT